MRCLTFIRYANTVQQNCEKKMEARRTELSRLFRPVRPFLLLIRVVVHFVLRYSYDYSVIAVLCRSLRD